MKGASVAIRRLSTRGVRIRIITHRLYIKDFHQQAVQQTVEWLDHHDIRYSDLCFLKDKTAVGANLYVEDSPENIEALKAEKQKVIIFTNSTNREMPGNHAANWEQVEEKVLAYYAQWQARHKRKRKK
jgi:5'(3')-deoxyribonucleotidase